jgi:hypothetical protein
MYQLIQRFRSKAFVLSELINGRAKVVEVFFQYASLICCRCVVQPSPQPVNCGMDNNSKMQRIEALGSILVIEVRTRQKENLASHMASQILFQALSFAAGRARSTTSFRSSAQGREAGSYQGTGFSRAVKVKKNLGFSRWLFSSCADKRRSMDSLQLQQPSLP